MKGLIIFIFVAFVYIGLGLLAGVPSDDEFMLQCQKKHSYEVCIHTLNP